MCCYICFVKYHGELRSVRVAGCPVLRRAPKWPCRNPAGRMWWRKSDGHFFPPPAFLCGGALRWLMLVVLRRLCPERDILCNIMMICVLWLFERGIIWGGIRCWEMIDGLGLLFCVWRCCVLQLGISDVLSLWQPWLQPRQFLSH